MIKDLIQIFVGSVFFRVIRIKMVRICVCVCVFPKFQYYVVLFAVEKCIPKTITKLALSASQKQNFNFLFI